MLNSYLDETYNHIFQCYRDLKMDGKLITAKSVKARYLGEDEKSRTLSDIVAYHGEDMVDQLKWGTQKNYFTTQKYLSKFLKARYKTTDMYLKELDYDFIVKFERFLRNHKPTDHQKPMGNNTVMKHIERFRKLIGLAIKLGWIDRDPFATTVTLSNGVPIETVSKLLGHSKIATTQIYARVIERKVSEDMAILREKQKRHIIEIMKADEESGTYDS